MSDNIARQPKGRPTGGQFAATAKSETEIDSLDVVAPSEGAEPAASTPRPGFAIPRRVLETLPEWPLEGEPRIEVGYADDGSVMTTIHVEGYDESLYTQGCRHDDNVYSNYSDLCTGLADHPKIDQAYDYLDQTHEWTVRAEVEAERDTFALRERALSRHFGLTPDDDRGPVTRGEERVEELLRAYATHNEYEDSPETALSDLLADMSHYAHRRGIDFDHASAIASRHAAEEQSFDEG